MNTRSTSRNDYQRVAKAIRYLQCNVASQPGLDEVARHVGLSRYHFQRLFQRWAGTSPKRFLEYLTVARAKRLLRASHSVLDSALTTGLSGPGRLHDQFVNIEAVSPGEFKRRGATLEIAYGVHHSPFGQILLATTARGICSLRFLDGADITRILEELRMEWPLATLRRTEQQTAAIAGQIFTHGDGAPGTFNLHVRGTNFQTNVWRALLRIPAGRVCSYGQLAKHLQRPRAARAVANAVAANPVAYLIPCHRVLRSSGALGGYRWSPERKRILLTCECTPAPPPRVQGAGSGQDK